MQDNLAERAKAELDRQMRSMLFSLAVIEERHKRKEARIKGGNTVSETLNLQQDRVSETATTEKPTET